MHAHIPTICAGCGATDRQAMKYMMDTDDLANKLRQFTLVAVVVKVGAFLCFLVLLSLFLSCRCCCGCSSCCCCCDGCWLRRLPSLSQLSLSLFCAQQYPCASLRFVLWAGELTAYFCNVLLTCHRRWVASHIRAHLLCRESNEQNDDDNGHDTCNDITQACGLILAAGGGLNIGREGPYTHLGGMVSYQLIRNVPFFHDILKKETVLRQVCTVCCFSTCSSMCVVSSRRR